MDRWSEAVNKSGLSNLSKYSTAYKYIVNSFIMEKTKGAGAEYNLSLFWDTSTDYSRTISWENDELLCIATAFIVGL